MKKHNFFKRTVCIAAAAAALFTSAAIPFPAAAAEDDATETIDVSTLPTHLMNGDFEWPSIDTAIDIANPIKNSSGETTGTYTSNTNQSYHISNEDRHNVYGFEDTDIIYRLSDPWFVTTREIFDDILNDQYGTDKPNSFYWETTASDDRIELATATAKDTASDDAQYFDGTTEARSKNQFAELVATESSSLYQSISTPEAGNILTWSLSHRAKSSTGVNDTMAVFIGPKQDYLKKNTETANDLFQQMAKLITESSDWQEISVGQSPTVRTIYSKKIDSTTIIDDSVVSNNKQEDQNIDQEWKCWIIRSDDTKWYDYSGSYTVPADQPQTTFAFTSLNSSSDGLSGNCLDNIEFGIQFPLTVVTNYGGTGLIECDGVPLYTVENGSAYNGNASEDSTITITATANTYGSQQYQFVGAKINDTFIGINENGFNRNNDGSYTYSFKMNEGKHVQLYFSIIGEVYYDPNGGVWKNSAGYDIDKIYKFERLTDVLTQSVSPQINGQTFLHWEVFASDGTHSYNITVGANHTITFDATETAFSLKDTNDESHKIDIDENADQYAILLRAVYTQVVEVQPCTKYFGSETLVHKDAISGTVTITNDNEYTENNSSSIQVEEGTSFTVTATPNDGFEIISWWYEYIADDNETHVIIPLDNAGDKDTYTATYNGSKNVTIHVQFAEKPIAPYLSVVAQNEDAKKTLFDKGIISQHGYVTGNALNEKVSDSYGGTQYGNTIATGFFAKRTFDATYENISGVWTINVPVIDTFLKVPQSELTADGKAPSETYPHLTGEAIIADENVNTGAGSIFKASGENNEYNKQFRFYTEMDTTITDGDVVFGIVIDNLYAPNAQAGFMAAEAAPTDVPTLDDDDSVLATPDDKYEQSEFDQIPID